MSENVEPQPQQQKGAFARMGLLQKVLLFIGALIVLVVVAGIVLGGIQDFYQFFFYTIVLAIVIITGYVIVKAVGLIFQPRYYSPREDLRVKLMNMASDYRPDNVRDLWFQGDVGKQRVRAGKIVGLLGMPYYTGKEKRYDADEKGHKKGDIVYTNVKDFENKRIPVYEDIQPKTDESGKTNYLGDTLFIVKKGWFLFAKLHFIRCNRDLHGDLHGDVTIFDINPQPYGYFEYPFKQMQTMIAQVMVQNQIETILATHEHQHDLISQGVDSAIYFNPVYRYSMKQGSEIPEQG